MIASYNQNRALVRATSTVLPAAVIDTGTYTESPWSFDMLSGKDIIYFGADSWDGVLWRDRHEICTRLAKNNRVIYVENRPYFRNLRQRLWNGEISWQDLRHGSLQELSPNLFAFRYPDWAPIAGRFPFRQIFAIIRRIAIRSALKRIGVSRPIVWFNTPNMIDLVDDVPSPELRIYHVVDQYCAFKGHTEEIRQKVSTQEEQMLKRVNLVITSHAGLLEEKRITNPNTFLVPNGVRYEHYDRARRCDRLPTAIRQIRRPRLGFSGFIGDRIDLAMLINIAKKHEEWSLVFLGDHRFTHCQHQWNELVSLSNVHVIGRTGILNVPYYVKGFDIGLIPYKQDDESEFICPMKLFDYLAAGISVASIEIPGVRSFDDLIHVAETPRQFESAITSALTDRLPDRTKARLETAYKNSWAVRIEQISEVLESALHWRATAPSDC